MSQILFSVVFHSERVYYFLFGGMKLSEYFQQQKSQALTSQMKGQIFSRIQKEKSIWTEISTKLPSKMFFFVSKRIMYTSLAAILVFVVFGWLLLDKTQIVDFWIFSVKQSNTPNGVFADYVAEIVEFNGEYSLVRDGKVKVDSKNLKTIQNWDTISLPEWTDLIFTLQDGTKSKIIWPAEFSITKTEKSYQISLFDGKFFRIYCPECGSDVEIITPEFSISQEKDQTLDVHIAKEENGKLLVKNDWDKITVKTKEPGKDPTVTQISSEVVAINTNSDEINIVEDSEIMLNFMSKNNISATFTLSKEKVEWPEIKREEANKIVLMQDKQESKQNPQNIKPEEAENLKDNTVETMAEEKDPLLEWIKEIVYSDNKDAWVVDENIILQLWIADSWQKVPTESQMQSLKTNLNSFFLMNIFESIYNNDKVDQNISKFADRINSISSSFGYSDRASADLLSIKSTIQTLKNKLEKDWYVSPSYILQMEKVVNRCDELRNPSQPNWESLKSNLPLNLRLM